MAEYIDKNKAINAVFEAFADGRSAYIALEAIPAADVVPVRHGEWRLQKIPFKGGHGQTLTKYKCSACKGYNRASTPHCPNCGAKMDGEA